MNAITRKKVVLFLSMLSMLIMLERIATCEIKALIISGEGDFLFLNPTDYSIEGKGNLKEDVIREQNGIAKNIIQKTSIFEVFPDIEGNRTFLLIGQGQEERMYGFLVFQLYPFKFQQFFELDMALGPVGFLMRHKDGKLYLSYLIGNEEAGYKNVTVAFDAQSYKRIKEYTHQFFRIFKGRNCADDNKLYIGKLIFDIISGEVVEELDSDLPFICENGHILSYASKTTDNPVSLKLYNLKSRPFIKKDIKTNEVVDGIRSDEWHLTKDVKFIIREEEKRGKGKTGRLVFFDIENNKKKELKVFRKAQYGGGIIGFSESGELLFYNSAETIYVINVQNQSIVKEIQLPFNPIGIIWP